jgi:HAD superfamily hydrolase (TIGR01509 family)
MGQIKAILFDMDGVLIDAKEWHYEALNRALNLFGMPISRYDHLNTYDGLPTIKKLEMISKERGLPRALHPFINKLKQQFTTELIYQHCKPYFRHQYALSRLKTQQLQIAVCSNSIRKTIDLMMERADLQRYLDIVLSNEDVKSPKPDPEIYLTAVQRLRLTPRECMIIEDNPHGLEAARRSGCHVMQVDLVDEVNFENIMSKISYFEGVSND